MELTICFTIISSILALIAITIENSKNRVYCLGLSIAFMNSAFLNYILNVASSI